MTIRQRLVPRPVGLSVCRSVGLSQRPYELSGGQQQRVAIARALANRPELLDLRDGRAAPQPAGGSAAAGPA